SCARSPACPWPSRSRTTWWACRRRGACRPTRIGSPRRTPWSSIACSARASCSSARPTCRSISRTGRASTRSTAPRTTRGTSNARPADRPAARRRRWRPGSRVWRPAATSAPRPVNRRASSRGGVAAPGIAGREAGSDIGSSIRTPAHFCGAFGHKPTWGIVPRAGQALPWQNAPVDIDVVGPLARSADDLAVAPAVRAGPDEIDGAGWQLRLAPPRQKRLRDFKVALMLDTPEIPVDAAVTDRLQALGDFLRRQKVKVDDRARPAIDTREAFSVYVKLLRAATSDRQSDAEFGRRAA